MAAPTQEDVDALQAAIRSGARVVKFTRNGVTTEVEYRTPAEMRQALAEMEGELDASKRAPRRSVARFRSDLGPSC